MMLSRTDGTFCVDDALSTRWQPFRCSASLADLKGHLRVHTGVGYEVGLTELRSLNFIRKFVNMTMGKFVYIISEMKLRE